VPRIVVLASGTGSLLQAILDSTLNSSVVAVGSDVESAPALLRAEEASVRTFVLPVGDDREVWNKRIVDKLTDHDPDVIVCAGFMRVLGPHVVRSFPGKIINSHPALLPSFPGAHAVRDALSFGVKVTGCTIHVVDEGVDTGPILAQQPVFIEATDTEHSLHERIKEVERVLLVDVVGKFLGGKISIAGRSVTIGE
jgi:phosphoribosylglycinamide formyltransferase-1